MIIQQPVSWLDIYQKLVALESQLQDLSQMIWQLKPAEGPIECQHPVQLEGIWAGCDISDDDLAAARQSMFPYEKAPFRASPSPQRK